MRYGYARVSSDTQDYAAQVEALKAAGCDKIFSEKASGKSTSGRREFDKLMRALLPGDTVMVTRLDRLARSSRDLHNILHELEVKGSGFVSIGESWCDTRSDIGRLMMTIMGGIAQFERSLIRKRCQEGIDRAKAKGTRLAARPCLMKASASVSRNGMQLARRWPSLRARTRSARPRSGGRCGPPRNPAPNQKRR